MSRQIGIIPIMNNTTINNLNWRYATDNFDQTKKISNEQLELIKEVLRLTPSSFGLQLWKFYIIENPKMREDIKAASWNQPQTTDASHLILLASKKDANTTDVDEYIKSISETRKMPLESLDGFKKMLTDFISAMPKEALSNWMAKQIYIALGILIDTCAQNQIDSCPMEGFDKKAVSEIIGADKEGYEVQLMCPVGFRNDAENYKHIKVRYPIDKVVKVI